VDQLVGKLVISVVEDAATMKLVLTCD
jgi:hypothetical protein